MKKIIFSAALVVSFIACNKNDKTLIGKFELAEILSDPGDGSGVFETIVNSGKIIEFKEDGSIKANGDICTMNKEIDGNVKGTYSIDNSTISVDDCNNNLTYEFTNDELIIIYPCFEPCKAKYTKL